jgi:hypothetical protein
MKYFLVSLGALTVLVLTLMTSVIAFVGQYQHYE